MLFVKEGDALRIHCQFDPKEKRRTAVALYDAFEKVTSLAASNGYSKIVFESISPTLIGFFTRLGFQKSNGDDYVFLIRA